MVNAPFTSLISLANGLPRVLHYSSLNLSNYEVPVASGLKILWILGVYVFLEREDLMKLKHPNEKQPWGTPQ
jgi:hypothetical protein